MQNEYRSLISKIQQLEEVNSVSAEKAEDTLLLGMAADIIYQTEDSVLLADQILERISVLKDIPFCCCLELGVDGLIVEGFYASFSEIQKDEIQVSFSKACSELLQTERYLILENSDFESRGLSVQFGNQALIPTSALIYLVSARVFITGISYFSIIILF